MVHTSAALQGKIIESLNQRATSNEMRTGLDVIYRKANRDLMEPSNLPSE
jgi:hypothetical protein